MLHNKIALGTVQFGLDYGVANQTGKLSIQEVKKIMLLAKTSGLDMLDTAIGYGESEQVLGDVGVTDFQVVTKLPGLPAGVVDVKKWVSSHIEASLSRLKISHVYAVLLHKPSDLLGAQGLTLADALRHQKQLGVVQKIGVSIYEPEDLAKLMRLMDIDLVQAPLNVIDRRLVSTGWLDRLKNKGVEVHTRSAFLQGLLLMGLEDMPEKFKRWSCLWDKWHIKLSDSNSSALAACLAYPLALPGVDRVILGVDGCAHLQEIIATLSAIDFDIDTSFMASTDSQLINPSHWGQL